MTKIPKLVLLCVLCGTFRVEGCGFFERLADWVRRPESPTDYEREQRESIDPLPNPQVLTSNPLKDALQAEIDRYTKAYYKNLPHLRVTLNSPVNYPEILVSFRDQSGGGFLHPLSRKISFFGRPYWCLPIALRDRTLFPYLLGIRGVRFPKVMALSRLQSEVMEKLWRLNQQGPILVLDRVTGAHRVVKNLNLQLSIEFDETTLEPQIYIPLDPAIIAESALQDLDAELISLP